MTEPITIDKLELAGFRAYLKPVTFKLHRRATPLNLAVFSPNGRGKSGLVDSLEYYFSENGTLKRLGQRPSSTQAGLGAVRHVDAEEKNVETSVSIWFRQGIDKFGGPRQFSSPLTDAAKRVLSHAKVPFVIRGYELRQFIDGAKPIDRYKELVTWFELDPLLAVQENLKALKRQVGKMVTDTTDAKERSRDLASVTGGAVRKWDEPGILNWLNGSVLAALDKSLKLEALSDDDPALQELENRKRTERERAGIEMLENLLATIEMLHEQPVTHSECPAGQIASFEKSVLGFKDAATNEATARSTTSESVFGEVWTNAKKLLGSGAEFDKCPVCDTEFAKSPSGSRSGVYASLNLNLANLEGYRMAEAAKKNAEAELGRTARDLGEALERFPLLAGLAYRHDTVTAYRKALRSWKVGERAPDSKGVTDTLARLHASVSADIGRIGQQQGEHTYASALETIRRLLATKAELERIKRTKYELQTIRDGLGRQAGAFGAAIVEHVRSLVGELQDEVGSLYKYIQGSHVKVPPIRIELAGEGAADPRSAQLLIDFTDSCKDAMPGGFLSDSQIHTLALSLRLAAIRKFNTGTKILALDDIVTSYDADHRKNIAAMLSKYFGDFQIIIVTHDKHFFDLLPDHLAENCWRFAQIKELRPGVGPIFEDHMVRDEEIEVKLKAGEDAVNDIRKAEEEWLYRICLEFETPTTFQRNHKPRLNELAVSLDQFLKGCGLESPKVAGSSRPFLESLQRAKIENLGSHSGDDPYVSPSGGDARTRWEEFKRFRSLFVCQCGHVRFKRPDQLQKPICAKCETQFAFGPGHLANAETY